ncbi:MAG TPA: hypothetical protein DCM87_08615 [Planctomycetes bacterium]|nr:hypothetical protein [Planctomycetota bacterium]
MKKPGESDILQITILTLFMVSGVLLVINIWFGSRRAAAYDQATAAVAENAQLQKALREESLRRMLGEERRLRSTEAGRKDFSAEINERAQNELRQTRSTPASPRPSESYIKWTKRLDAPIKDFGRDLAFWLSFLGRIESERPDIHVESVTLTTTEYDIVPGGAPRMWGMNANFVYWEQKGADAAR